MSGGGDIVDKVESFFYEDEDFSNLFETFANKHAHRIDLKSEEMKLEYTDIYNEFQKLFEKTLSGNTREKLHGPRAVVFRPVNLLVPPRDPDAHIGFIIMEPEDTPPMSGSNAICVATVVLDSGIVPMTEPRTDLVLEANPAYDPSG